MGDMETFLTILAYIVVYAIIVFPVVLLLYWLGLLHFVAGVFGGLFEEQTNKNWF